MTKEELIKSIRPNEANLKYISQTGIINGSLYLDIERILQQYADQQCEKQREICAEKYKESSHKLLISTRVEVAILNAPKPDEV